MPEGAALEERGVFSFDLKEIVSNEIMVTPIIIERKKIFSPFVFLIFLLIIFVISCIQRWYKIPYAIYGNFIMLAKSIDKCMSKQFSCQLTGFLFK